MSESTYTIESTSFRISCEDKERCHLMMWMLSSVFGSCLQSVFWSGLTTGVLLRSTKQIQQIQQFVEAKSNDLRCIRFQYSALKYIKGKIV